jgi:hypothetical protein
LNHKEKTYEKSGKKITQIKKDTKKKEKEKIIRNKSHTKR